MLKALLNLSNRLLKWSYKVKLTNQQCISVWSTTPLVGTFFKLSWG